MARITKAPTNIGKLIDRVEQIREELLTIQRSMEKLEYAPSSQRSASRDKKSE